MSEILEVYEDFIFEIIQDYLNNKSEFRMDKVIPYLRFTLGRSRININNRGIVAMMVALVGVGIIINRKMKR